MIDSGLVITLRFGQSCKLGDLEIRLIEPVAGFVVTEKPEQKTFEHYITINSQSNPIPSTNNQYDWQVYRPSFTSANCTLALVDLQWFQQSNNTEDFPPGIRMEFTNRNRFLSWDDQTFEWLGNGADVQIGDSIYTMLEGDREIIGPSTIIFEKLKGRGGVQFRFIKPREIRIQRID